MTKQAITIFGSIRSALGALCLAAALSLAACGAATEKHEAEDKCFKQCGLQAMTCLESSQCMDVNGQFVPCEEECEQKRLECEQAC